MGLVERLFVRLARCVEEHHRLWRHMGDKQVVRYCLDMVATMEARVLLANFLAGLFTGAHAGIRHLVIVVPYLGKYSVCFICNGPEEECRRIAEAIAEYIEGFPMAIATVLNRSEKRWCVWTVSEDEARGYVL